MMKRLPKSLVRLAIWVVLGLLWFGEPRGWAISAGEADAAFDSFNSAFYVVSNGRGYYKADTAGGRADFWKSAEMIEMIIDAYERLGNPAYKTMISQSIDGFMYYNGSDWLGNKYNDDVMWMVIACCRGFSATGNTTYRDRAKYHFDAVYSRGWDTALGGGIWWTTDKKEKNACINGPAVIAACLLYRLYGDTNYLQKAQAIYAWERNVLFEAATGKVLDNINSSGVITDWIFTYNQGTFIGAGHYLNQLTGIISYYDDALKAALYCKNGMCTSEILPEYGDAGDGGGFTGVLARWLGRFVRERNLHGTFYPWMAQNANAAWTVRRADNLSWCKWRTQTPATNLTSFGCSSSVAWMQAVPTDYGLPGLLYNPMPLTSGSYNRDVIVEKTAPSPPVGGGYTTATMDGGLANNDRTWFERGQLPSAPNTGLPAPGSIMTNFVYPDHQFLLAPSYSANNAVFLSSGLTSASVVPAAPSAYSAFSFLTAASHGPVTINCQIRHADGTLQVRSFVSPDWFNQQGMAWVANGRVHVVSGAYDAVLQNNPRLYAVDIPVVNTSSPVTNLVLTFSSGGAGSAAVILAVSGIPGTVAPFMSRQPESRKCWEGAPFNLSAAVAATAPLGYQWQKGVGGFFTNILNSTNISGAISSNLVLMRMGMADGGDHRLVATNPAGSVTSAVATITVMSSLPDITQPTDVITGFGGASPAGEGVTFAIGDNTSKYLNFGLNNGAGNFIGPVGFVVTPARGLFVARFLRFYTGNDEPGRDPASFALYGSNDGGLTYSFISSGALSLPAERNPGGAPLDPISQNIQQVALNNSRSYRTYKLNFNSIKTSAASMMQVGEVEVLGVVVPVLTIQPGPVAGTLTLRSSAPGRLWSTGALEGAGTAWQDEGAITSPVTVVPVPGVPARFYRVSVP